MFYQDFNRNSGIFASRYLKECDYTVINFICLISLFVFGNSLLNISKKYMMELFILSVLLPIIIYIK